MDNYFCFGGVRIRSSLPLPELMPLANQSLDDETPDARTVSLRFCVDDRLAAFGVADHGTGDAATTPQASRLEATRIDPVVERRPDGVAFNFPGIASFAVSERGERVEVSWNPSLDASTLRHLLLDHVLPRVLAYHGSFVLHGALVQVHDGAICLVGESGRGKSTLAAAFHTHGYPLLSDDGAVLVMREDGVHATGTYPSLRLWPESADALFAANTRRTAMAHYSEKQRLDLPIARHTIAPVRAIIALDAPSPAHTTIAVTSLAPRAGCMALIGNSFQLDLGNPRDVETHFAQAAQLASRVAVMSLQYPRTYAALAEVQRAILDAL